MPTAAHPDPEALLAHRRFVRSVASRLLLDPSDVDEVEQKTWLSALGQAGRAPRELRAWLHRVARNHSLDLLRGRSRARARERVASRPEAIEDTGAVVARMESARVLVRTVMKLDDPLREALLLRYYENCSVAETAARLGLSRPAVKSRIQRGLAKLRSELDRSRGGEESTWREELAALVAIPAGAPAGAAAMAKLALVGLTAAAAAGVLWSLRPGKPVPGGLQGPTSEPIGAPASAARGPQTPQPQASQASGGEQAESARREARGQRVASGEVTLAIGDAFVLGERGARPDGDRSRLDLYVMDIRHGVSLACFQGAVEATPPLTSVGLPESPLETFALIRSAPTSLPRRDLWLLERCSAERVGVGFARGLDGRTYKLCLVELKGHPEALRRTVRIRYEEVPAQEGGGSVGLPEITEKPSGVALSSVQRALDLGARIPGQRFHEHLVGDYGRLDSPLPVTAIRPKSHVVAEVPLEVHVQVADGSSLVAAQGIAPAGTVELAGSSALTVLGALRGGVLVDGYSYVYVEGSLEGRLDIESYATVYLAGDLRGTVAVRSYTDLYLGGRPLGTLDVAGSCTSTFYFDGFYSASELTSFPGDLGQVTLHVRSSNLADGTHRGVGTWRNVVVGDPVWKTLGR